LIAAAAVAVVVLGIGGWAVFLRPADSAAAAVTYRAAAVTTGTLRLVVLGRRRLGRRAVHRGRVRHRSGRLEGDRLEGDRSEGGCCEVGRAVWWVGGDGGAAGGAGGAAAGRRGSVHCGR
jgi:membrane protein implicated in regulation of membrane protease activity